METIGYRSGENAKNGGLDIIISLPPQEARALSGEVEMLADWFDTALWALSMFRTGSNARGPLDIDPSSAEVTHQRLWRVISDMDHRLLPRLQGIRDMAVRRHKELGGTLNDLALAMDVKKSTAQSRLGVILNGKERPSVWENWALQGGPQDREYCQACGHPPFPTDPLLTTDDEDRYRIHRSHTQNPEDGFYGTPTVAPDSEPVAFPDHSAQNRSSRWHCPECDTWNGPNDTLLCHCCNTPRAQES
ncbi:hypothetical protein ACWGDE_24830 [Streptomyces sp. NPDC054956]